MIYGQCYDRHRDVFADKVCLRGGVGRLSVHEFGAADHRILGNLFGLRNLFGTMSGERSVKSATDFATFLRSRRFNRQVRIETCLREECRLGFVVVFVFLESARRRFRLGSRGGRCRGNFRCGDRVLMGGGGGLCCGRTCGSNGGGAARRGECYGDSNRVAGFGIDVLDCRNGFACSGVGIFNDGEGIARYGIDVGRVRVESCERVSLVVTFSNGWKGCCIDRVLIGRIARASAEYRPDKDG